MFQKNKKGFTLIEILVVVLIIAILTAIGMMEYDRFVERARSAEADNIIGLVSYAQTRQMMRKGSYTNKWTALDAAPLAAYMDKTGDYINEEGTIFLTKGGGIENPRSGFEMYFENIEGSYFIVAHRIGSSNYGYTFVRPIEERKTYCVPSFKRADMDFCLEYMNVDDESELPADPRTLVVVDEQEQEK